EPPWIPRVASIVGALTVCGAGDGLSITTQAHAPTNVPPRHANASITRSIPDGSGPQKNRPRKAGPTAPPHCVPQFRTRASYTAWRKGRRDHPIFEFGR